MRRSTLLALFVLLSAVGLAYHRDAIRLVYLQACFSPVGVTFRWTWRVAVKVVRERLKQK